MYINAIEFRSISLFNSGMKMRYDKVTYSTFIDRYYMDHDLKLKELEYETYLQEIDSIHASS
jgi:hypothetical protein